jgi:hypothetical protein
MIAKANVLGGGGGVLKRYLCFSKCSQTSRDVTLSHIFPYVVTECVGLAKRGE